MSNSLLDEVFRYKRQVVAHQKQMFPLADMRAAAERALPASDMIELLNGRGKRTWPALIAEVKFASPSKGVLVANPDPLRLARAYQANGAAAISVLTDERYFHGKLEYLSRISQMTPRLPVLRKDFICDPYQVYEARAAGADAVLLIAAGLSAKELGDLYQLSLSLGMTPLIEVHTLPELLDALECQPRLLGINNRDLHSLQVSLETTLQLRRFVPVEVCLVAESGISTHADVRRLAEAGVDAILVGEALVTAADLKAKMQELTAGE